MASPPMQESLGNAESSNEEVRPFLLFTDADSSHDLWWELCLREWAQNKARGR